MINRKAKKLSSIFLAIYFFIVFFTMTINASATSDTQEMNKFLFVLPGANGNDGMQQRNICFALELPNAPNIPGVEFELAWDEAVRTTSGQSVTAYTAKDDIDEKLLQAWDEEVLEQYDVTRIHPATVFYNCHSYAWHQAADTNIYYIGNIDAYLADPHCTEISNATLGAIVVYFDAAGEPLHSAIVTSAADGVVICQSKWGICGVFEHELDEVPYDYTANGSINVRYYLYEKVHGHLEADAYTSTHHTLKCAVCEYETAVQHTYAVTHTVLDHTRYCRYCDWAVTEPHTYDSLKNRCTICGRPAGNTPVQPFYRKTEKVTMAD